MSRAPAVGRRVRVKMDTGRLEYEGVVHSVLGQQFVLDEGEDVRFVFRNDNDWRYIKCD